MGFFLFVGSVVFHLLPPKYKGGSGEPCSVKNDYFSEREIQFGLLFPTRPSVACAVADDGDASLEPTTAAMAASGCNPLRTLAAVSALAETRTREQRFGGGRNLPRFLLQIPSGSEEVGETGAGSINQRSCCQAGDSFCLDEQCVHLPQTLGTVMRAGVAKFKPHDTPG